jgi:hypothetical protein
LKFSGKKFNLALYLIEIDPDPQSWAQCPLSIKKSVVRCSTDQLLTLSLAAPFAPPCLEALGLIGPRKKGKKLVLMTSARSDWTKGRLLRAIAIAASPLPLPQGFQFLFFIYVACDT